MGEYVTGRVKGGRLTAKGLVFPGVWAAALGKGTVPRQRRDFSMFVKIGNGKDWRRTAQEQGTVMLRQEVRTD